MPIGQPGLELDLAPMTPKSLEEYAEEERVRREAAEVEAFRRMQVEQMEVARRAYYQTTTTGGYGTLTLMPVSGGVTMSGSGYATATIAAARVWFPSQTYTVGGPRVVEQGLSQWQLEKQARMERMSRMLANDAAERFASAAEAEAARRVPVTGETDIIEGPCVAEVFGGLAYVDVPRGWKFQLVMDPTRDAWRWRKWKSGRSGAEQQEGSLDALAAAAARGLTQTRIGNNVPKKSKFIMEFRKALGRKEWE